MSREPDNTRNPDEELGKAPDPRLERIQEKLKALPAAPGVYLHKNKQGKVIYVGKANRLNQRVRSYFRENVEDEKTRQLAGKVHDVDYIVTGSGNDALVLTRGGTAVDSFGQVGVDPGSYWSCTEGTTQNSGMRRLSGVCAGDVILDDAFDPCAQWAFFPLDLFTGLGEHLADCGAVSAEVGETWGSVKALYR